MKFLLQLYISYGDFAWAVCHSIFRLFNKSVAIKFCFLHGQGICKPTSLIAQ